MRPVDINLSCPAPFSSPSSTPSQLVGILAKNIFNRQWWLLVLAFGCLFEAARNACRVYGHYKPFNSDVYTAMQTILVITPALFAAIDFAILGRLATLLPARYSLSNPKWIRTFFSALNVSSIAILDGSFGAAAGAQSECKATSTGGNVVVVGLGLQLVGYVLFNLLLLVLMRRCFKNPPTSNPWNKRTKTFILPWSPSPSTFLV